MSANKAQTAARTAIIHLVSEGAPSPYRSILIVYLPPKVINPRIPPAPPCLCVEKNSHASRSRSLRIGMQQPLNGFLLRGEDIAEETLVSGHHDAEAEGI